MSDAAMSNEDPDQVDNVVLHNDEGDVAVERDELAELSRFQALLVTLGGRLQSLQSVADQLGRDRRRVVEDLETLACAVQEQERRTQESILGYLEGAKAFERINLVSVIASRKYDETKLK
eukprot:6262790-Amphidinium_carterae.1